MSVKVIQPHFLQRFLLLLVFMGSMFAQAQTLGPNRVLIRNVTLFDPSATVEDKVVNILLCDNKLDIVTEDAARVSLIGFGEFSIDIEVFAHVGTTNWARVSGDRRGHQSGQRPCAQSTGAKLAEPAR